MRKIFLMCAGDQFRWGEGKPKQFSCVNGERLIDRVRRQYGDIVCVVTHREEIAKDCREVLVPEKHSCICESILSTKEKWKDINVFLLGDVYYTDETLKRILECKCDCCFYGNIGEIYALVFMDKKRLERGLRTVIADYAPNQSRGKLWELYYCLSGLDIRKAWHGRQYDYRGGEDKEHWIEVNDGTRDFDTPEEYKTYLQT